MCSIAMESAVFGIKTMSGTQQGKEREREKARLSVDIDREREENCMGDNDCSYHCKELHAVETIPSSDALALAIPFQIHLNACCGNLFLHLSNQE